MFTQIQEVLAQFNWVDIFILLMFLRCFSIGAKKGIVIEIFKIVGWIIALYVSLHYFSQASDLLTKKAAFIAVSFADLLAFSVLTLLPYISVALFRETVLRLIKVEAQSALDRWGGFFFGLLKGFIVISALLIGFYFLDVSYLKESLKKSYLGPRLLNTNVKIYSGMVNGLVSKLAPSESFNKDIYEVLEDGEPGVK